MEKICKEALRLRRLQGACTEFNSDGFCVDEGYWRKQMEHICGHLKAHAADSVNFRALVAEPRLGKV